MTKIGIGTKLGLSLAVMLTLALSTMAYLADEYFQEHFIESHYAQQKLLVLVQADEVENKLNILKDMVRSIAQDLPPNLMADAVGAQGILHARIASNQIFDGNFDDGLMLLSADSRIVASTHCPSYALGEDLGLERELVRKTLLTGQPQVSEPIRLQDGKHQELLFSALLPGEKSDILVACMNLKNNNFLTRIGSRHFESNPDHYFYLVNQSSEIFTGKPSTIMTSLVSSYLRDLQKSALGAHANQIEKIETAGDKNYFVTSAKIGSTGWSLIAISPTDYFVTALHKARTFFFSLMLIVLSTMGLVFWWFIHKLTYPLRMFTGHLSNYLGTGVLPSPVDIKTRDEIGTLAEAFNQLVVELSQEHQNLVDARHFAQQQLLHLPNPCLTINSQGEVLNWNQALEKMTGLSASQVLGKNNAWSAFYKQSRPILANYVLNPKLDKFDTYYPDAFPLTDVPGGWKIEEMSTQADGSNRYLSYSAAPIRDAKGDIIAAIESIDDLTTVKQLADQERRHRQLLEAVSQAILDYLNSCRISRLAGTLMTRLSELTGAQFGLLFDYEESGDARILGACGFGAGRDKIPYFSIPLKKALAHGEYLRIPRNDGLLFSALSQGETLIENEPGHHYLGFTADPEYILPVDSFLCVPLKIGETVVGGIGLANRPGGFGPAQILEVETFARMTALAIQGTRSDEKRKQVEEQLRTTQKFEAIGQLAGGVAHDFNNLLTVINGFSSLLVRRLKSDDPNQKDAQSILKAGQQAERLTKQLLAFSRQQIIKARSLDLESLITDFSDLLQRLVPRKIKLEFLLPEQPVKVLADPGQVEQILMNLIVNARDAIGEKSGQITLSVKNCQLDETFCHLHPGAVIGNYGCIMIVDNGCGMYPEVVRRIFDPFYTTKGQGRGTGLGLSTVYGIVKQSGGFIDIQSTPGEGSCFTVYLPEAIEETARLPEKIQQQPEDNVKILLVDDESAVLQLTEQMLQRHEYLVLTADSIASAVTLFAKHNGKIDLLLTDVGLANESGVTLAQQLREQQPDLRVLYISGYGELHKQKQNGSELTQNFLQKPYTPEELLHAVRKALENKPTKEETL